MTRNLWLLLALACSSKQPPAPVAESPPPAEAATASTAWAQRVLQDVDSAVAALEAAWNQPDDPDNPEWVAARLAHLVEIDQTIRGVAHPPAGTSQEDVEALFDGVGERMEVVDRRHTAELLELVERHGWIRISVFGKQAARNAWLLAQHADRDRAFQQAVLERMEPLVSSGDVEPKHYAYLFDRLAVANEVPQRFGTQGTCPRDGGPWIPGEVEEPDRIDEIRAEVGLGTMAEYQSRFDCGGHRAAADAAYATKDFPTCATLYAEYATGRIGEGAANAWYNAACCAALAGDPPSALANLAQAIDAGWDDRAHAEADNDLTSLHEEPGWTQALERMATHP